MTTMRTRQRLLGTAFALSVIGAGVLSGCSSDSEGPADEPTAPASTAGAPASSTSTPTAAPTSGGANDSEKVRTKDPFVILGTSGDGPVTVEVAAPPSTYFSVNLAGGTPVECETAKEVGDITPPEGVPAESTTRYEVLCGADRSEIKALVVTQEEDGFSYSFDLKIPAAE